MSDVDYETLFNDIMVQNREKRSHLKEVLDRVFEDDSGRTAEVLAEMLRINEKAQSIESSRPGFMSLMSAMRQVHSVREELLEKVDKLMDEIRRFLALKEELANDRLEKLTMLFREELGNPQFRFHFHLLDDQELHHLSEVRSNARRDGTAPPITSGTVTSATGSQATPAHTPPHTERDPFPSQPPAPAYAPPARAEREPEKYTPPPPPPAPVKAAAPVATPPVPAFHPPPAPPPAPAYTPPPPPPPRKAASPPPPPPAHIPEPEPEPAWAEVAAPAPVEEAAPAPWQVHEEQRPAWLSAPVDESTPMTIRGPAPDPIYATDVEAAPAPVPEPEPAPGGSPYEVDVDVLRILSEETFRPPKR